MKKWLFLTCFLSVAVLKMQAQEAFSKANALYDDAKYKQAAELYKQVQDEFPASAEVWYNLGNAYYKSGKIGYSIAAYRRALKLNPTDGDIRFNLDFVVAKSSDKIEPKPRGFIIRQTDLAADIFTPGVWAFWAVVLALVAVLKFMAYIFAKNYRLKKLGLIASVVFWMLSFACVALAAHRYYYALDSYAVVVTRSADILGEPTENGTRLLLLNEGATLKFETRQSGWIKVELPNGSKGYVKAESVEVI